MALEVRATDLVTVKPAAASPSIFMNDLSKLPAKTALELEASWSTFNFVVSPWTGFTVYLLAVASTEKMRFSEA
jgi:hypothetical protein